jgi:hypothetical protein
VNSQLILNIPLDLNILDIKRKLLLAREMIQQLEKSKEEGIFIWKFSEISIVVDYHTLPANQGMLASSSFGELL